MRLIDTHAHIYLPELSGELPILLKNADKEGVRKILMPAVDSSTHEEMFRIEKMNPEMCMAMMGVHPCSVNSNYQLELKKASALFEKRKFVAVGEIGLDFYWDKTYKKEQYFAFNDQIVWALQYDIPIVIHSRESIDECIHVVSEHQNACLSGRQGKLKGVFHCFSGNVHQAKQIMNLGFYLGIGGVVTFKNSGLDKVMDEITLDKVVLETDSPYLAPVPFRGKRNEPSYLKYIVEKIAEIKKMEMEEVGEITTANAEKLFGSSTISLISG